MDSNPEQHPADDARVLRSLVRGAGYVSFRMDPQRRAIYLMGKTREWSIIARSGHCWLNLYTMVCELPQEKGVRSRLLEAGMAANQRMSLSKFVVGGDHLVLELDYRMEHVDSGVFGNLIGLLHANAEEYYPKLFRIVAGDDVLEALTPIAFSSQEA